MNISKVIGGNRDYVRADSKTGLDGYPKLIITIIPVLVLKLCCLWLDKITDEQYLQWASNTDPRLVQKVLTFGDRCGILNYWLVVW